MIFFGIYSIALTTSVTLLWIKAIKIFYNAQLIGRPNQLATKHAN